MIMKRQASSKNAANRKVCWRFYWMFSFPSTEAWLQAQAKAGWYLAEVRHRFCFIFSAHKPGGMTYQFDYAGYLVDGYLAQLSSQNWLVYRADRRWNICARPYSSSQPAIRLTTRYDQQLEQHMKKTIPLVMALSIVMVVVTWYLIMTNYGGILVYIVAVIATLIAVYDVLRLTFFRIMLQQRIQPGQSK